jgi:hypothetical protein
MVRTLPTVYVNTTRSRSASAMKLLEFSSALRHLRPPQRVKGSMNAAVLLPSRSSGYFYALNARQVQSWTLPRLVTMPSSQQPR